MDHRRHGTQDVGRTRQSSEQGEGRSWEVLWPDWRNKEAKRRWMPTFPAGATCSLRPSISETGEVEGEIGVGGLKNKPTDLSRMPTWRPPQRTPVGRWAGAEGSSGGGNVIAFYTLTLLNAVLIRLLKEAGPKGKKTGPHTGSQAEYLWNDEQRHKNNMHAKMNGPTSSSF